MAFLHRLKDYVGGWSQTPHARGHRRHSRRVDCSRRRAGREIMLGGNDPVSLEGRLTTSGKVLPTSASRLEPHVGKRVKAHAIMVESVPSDEGFWIGSNEARVFVRLIIPVREESPVRIEAGERVPFTGALKRHRPGFAPAAQGVSRTEGAAELRRSPPHIAGLFERAQNSAREIMSRALVPTSTEAIEFLPRRRRTLNRLTHSTSNPTRSRLIAIGVFTSGSDHKGRGPRPTNRNDKMDVDVLTEIEINRPRDEVAAYASDPDNATAWYRNIKRVEWKSGKPLRIGSRIAFVAEFLGRTIAYTYEVGEITPGERFVMATTEGPFAMETTYSWSDTPSEGTKDAASQPRKTIGFRQGGSTNDEGRHASSE